MYEGKDCYFQMRARDAKLVLSSKTRDKISDPNDLLRSLIVSRVPRQMLSIA